MNMEIKIEAKKEIWIVETMDALLKLRILNKPILEEISEKESKKYLYERTEKKNKCDPQFMRKIMKNIIEGNIDIEITMFPWKE